VATTRITALALAAALTAAALTATAAAAAPSETERLHWIAVNGDGVLTEQHPDEPVNPASVVKAGTSLWALDRLGPAHRYTTVVGVAGEWDRAAGVLTGDLVVDGGADPDFQWENTFLVARALNRAGLHTVNGRLVVRGVFWNGWEHGVEQRVTDPDERGRRMGLRVIDSLDPRRWTAGHRQTWEGLCARRGWDPAQRPRVVVSGGVAVGGAAATVPILVHRSNPLPELLRRFNVYSNNDIIRIAEPLGDVAGLEAFLLGRLGADAGSIELATSSGERRNRMTVRLMARLIVELDAEAAEHGLTLDRLLPVIGCDPGPTRRMFPALAAPPLAGAVTGKTGTLTNTDGGVAVLAGTFTGADGAPVVFAVAAPRAGRGLQYWRLVEQRWLMALIDTRGGALAPPCGPPLPSSDTSAEVEILVADPAADPPLADHLPAE
jgi:D-alanyl-D-alanine carboxypeptidase/D-alanyl-D-alanine-endopeptidase (penicillin-binding protein 4)